jgi:hypothetical protein
MRKRITLSYIRRHPDGVGADFCYFSERSRKQASMGRLCQSAGIREIYIEISELYAERAAQAMDRLIHPDLD